MATDPMQHEYQADSEAVALAADSTKEIAEMDELGTISSVAYLPAAAIVGTVMPNSRHLNLANKTQAGAIIATLQLAAGVNPAAGVETQIPITGNAKVNKGDVLEWQSIHDGTGLVDPGGLVRIVNTRGDISH